MVKQITLNIGWEDIVAHWPESGLSVEQAQAIVDGFAASLLDAAYDGVVREIKHIAEHQRPSGCRLCRKEATKGR